MQGARKGSALGRQRAPWGTIELHNGVPWWAGMGRTQQSEKPGPLNLKLETLALRMWSWCKMSGQECDVCSSQWEALWGQAMVDGNDVCPLGAKSSLRGTWTGASRAGDREDRPCSREWEGTPTLRFVLSSFTLNCHVWNAGTARLCPGPRLPLVNHVGGRY